ncbi:hypothetical protein CC80DRAFT_430959 [Byssothecium circinans]|uniref:Initiator tRNA phosphoribosyl transferase n=1 Tax=Byssothecium circinans TaxID=147558 RepID=A0A6A5T918_9PLEO|nr:hypothetical protein CC80DRAFT_430959 [Byssothecium circinans]
MEKNPLKESDLLFPTSTLSLSTTLSSLKRSALSITNRLSSITSDSQFVQRVSDAYNLPLIANERCGSWYIPPSLKAESAYFKSTDGHMGEWGFSLRRVNLQVLKVVGERGGAVIVDSTRRGKSMPDALSKTIPIWCCVMNRALFPELLGEAHELYTPPQAVSQSEHAQIEGRIAGFVDRFLEVCRPDVEGLRGWVGKPLRPIWVTQMSSLPTEKPVFADFHPVVLCTASRRVRGAEGSEGGYVQGAADDHEAWARGLTPSIFWGNKERLLGTNEEELPDVIAELVGEEGEKGADAVPILIQPTKSLYVSTMRNVDLDGFDVVISCGPEPLTTSDAEAVKGKKYLHLRCQNGKLGSRDLRAQLAYLDPFVSSLPSTQAQHLGKVLVCCPTGKDLSVGVALAILCQYTDDEGVVWKEKRDRKFNKTFIKQRLAWLTTTDPSLNPPRGTLQSVNAVLMPNTSASCTTPLPSPPSNPTNQAAKLFSSLENASKPWTFTRTLTSELPTHPSGTVTGTATFTPFSSTSSPDTPLTTLLYSEEGDFVTSTGLRFTVRRKYIYQLKQKSADSDNNKNERERKGEEESHIAVYFHDDNQDSDKAKGNFGGLFVEMGKLEFSASEDDECVLEAKNRERHLCAEDLYSASWRFGGGMFAQGNGDGKEEGNREAKEDKWWEVRYDVKGPKKDYVSETRYTRV